MISLTVEEQQLLEIHEIGLSGSDDVGMVATLLIKHMESAGYTDVISISNSPGDV
jgi:hypothetical protein